MVAIIQSYGHDNWFRKPPDVNWNGGIKQFNFTALRPYWLSAMLDSSFVKFEMGPSGFSQA